MIRSTKSVVALLASGALMLTLAGCAGAANPLASRAARARRPAVAQSTSVSPQPLTLVETSYRWIPDKVRYPFNDAVDFAYVLKNPNPGLGATSTLLRVTMRDSAGKTSTDDFPVWGVRPGETIVGGSQSFGLDGPPASVQFQLLTPPGSWVPADRWVPADFKPLQVVRLQVHRAAGKPAPDLVGFPSDHTYFTGFVDNPNTVAVRHSLVGVLHRDAAGRIVALYDLSNQDGRIPAGGRVAFRIDAPDKLALGDAFEAFAQPWYETTGEIPVRKSR